MIRVPAGAKVLLPQFDISIEIMPQSASMNRLNSPHTTPLLFLLHSSTAKASHSSEGISPVCSSCLSFRARS